MPKNFLRQQLKLSQQQKLTPQFIQYLRVLQVSNQNLDIFLRKEMVQNPALDYEPNNAEDNDEDATPNVDDIELQANLSDSSFEGNEDFAYSSYGDKEHSDFLQNVISYSTSPFENLHNQLRQLELNVNQKRIADIIIGNLDSGGYLRRSIRLIADDFEIKYGVESSEEEVVEVLKRIQTLEPNGIAARNLSECLAIQISKKKDWRLRKVTVTILEQSLKLIIGADFELLNKKYDISKKEVEEIMKMLQTLNPKPGYLLSNTKSESDTPVKPDFAIYTKEKEFDVQVLNPPKEKLIKLNPTYLEMLNNPNNDKNTKAFIKEKIENVRNLQQAFNQRKEIFQDIINEIAKEQKEFFLSGDEKDLKPFLVKEVAQRLDVDTSIASKIISKKYVDTSYGILPLKKFFFEKSYNQEGEEINVKQLQSDLKQIITNENSKDPYNDHEIASLLKEKGYNVARRTVGKYREQLAIPKASLRKKNF